MNKNRFSRPGVKPFGFLALFFVLLLLSCDVCSGQKEGRDFIASGEYQGEYWPTDGWRSCAPEAVGMSAEKLRAVFEYSDNPNLNTQGVVIIKDGYIVAEAYWDDFRQNDRHESQSIAKSFSSALIGIAIDQGLIPGVDRYVYSYYPQWGAADVAPQKKRMTIKHLLTMTGGLQWNEEDYYNDTSNNDVFRMAARNDFIQYVLDKPVENEPGTHWYYSSGESMLLSGVLQQATGMPAFRFGQTKLFEPLGIDNISWGSDPGGRTITAWGVKTTVRNFAKFGYLYLKQGHWEDRRIISESWVYESTHPVNGLVNHYGYQWWFPSAYEEYKNFRIPENTFMALGIYLQRLYVVPEKNLVVVRVGNDANVSAEDWHTLGFLQLVLDAVIE